MGTSCGYLESADPPDQSDAFEWCFSYGFLLGADIVDIREDGSRCYYKRCGTTASITYSDAYGGYEVFSTLAEPFRQVTSESSAMQSSCGTVLVDQTVANVDASNFTQRCLALGAIYRGDVLDMWPNLWRCVVRECESAESLAFEAVTGSVVVYTNLKDAFLQLTREEDNLLFDCPPVATITLDGTESATQECIYQAYSNLADSFDLSSDLSECRLVDCQASESIAFKANNNNNDNNSSSSSSTSSTAPAYSSWSLLRSAFRPLTRPSEGVVLDCELLETYSLASADDFPGACFSRASVVGADSFDWSSDGLSCLLRSCGAATGLQFASADPGYESYSNLVQAWVRLTQLSVGASCTCTDVAEETISPEEYPEGCYSKAVVNGGDTVDISADKTKCYIKQCGTFDTLETSFVTDAEPKETFTWLDPRPDDDWESCPAGDTCADVVFFITAKLKGSMTPIGSNGAACDPEDSVDCNGGHARRHAYHAAMKEEMELQGKSVLLLDLGGMDFGGPFYGHPDYAYGEPTAMLSNLLPYDLCLFGPGEFLSIDSESARNQTVESFKKRNCPLLLSNGELKEPWEGLNVKKHRYIVKELVGGQEIGFVGFFPRKDELGYTFGSSVVSLDPNGRQKEITAGLASDLRVNSSLYQAALLSTKHTVSQLSDHYADVYRLATEASVDILMAQRDMQAQHPNLIASILLVGDSTRADQIEWLAKFGNFDAVLVADEDADETTLTTVESIENRSVPIIEAYGAVGFTAATFRFSQGSGLLQYSYEANRPLDALVGSNATVQEALIDLYAFIKDRNSNPFGNLTNPLVGGHRTDESPPSKYQCYYTDCSGGDIIGRALLWKIFDQGFEADLAFYNLGSLRSVLAGDGGTVSLTHCVRTLQFQNDLKLYTILGKDLYNGIKSFVSAGERGFMGAGYRVAMHEPCWEYVNHSAYSGDHMYDAWIGSSAEISACIEAGIDPSLSIIDVEIYVRDESQCESESVPCQNRVWQTLEKGRTYTMISSAYLSTVISGFEETEISAGMDAEALCKYIAAFGTLEVDSWRAYQARGAVRYDTPAEGWAAGNRIPSVKSSYSTIEAASTCPDGKYLPETATACEDCPAGQVSMTNVARDGCELCPAGFFGSEAGLSACSPCKAGTYADSTGTTECPTCSVGSYSDVAAMYCNSCKPGFYAPNTSSVECLACPRGKFSSESHASVCEDCPTGFSTSTIASEAASQCLCPEGSYAESSTSTVCLHCPRGLVCDEGSYLENLVNNSGTYPRLVEGYMSKESDPWGVYKCTSEKICPGGNPGVCGPNFDPESIACGLCSSGYYFADSECQHCEALEYWPALILAFVGCCGIVVLVFRSSTDLHNRSKTMVFCSVVAGILMSTFQTVALFHNLSVSWSGPLLDFTRQLQLVSLDLGVLRAACLTGNDPVRLFLGRHLMAPAACVGSFLCLLVKVRSQPTAVAMDLVNSAGTIVNIFYISLVTACMLPLFCYEHPSGHGSSMRIAPSILCFKHGSFEKMLAIAIVSFCCIPLPFTAAVTFGTWKYPTLMASGNNIQGRTLMQYRFWWVRFRHERYYYGLLQLVRSLGMALVPVIVTDDTVLQIGILIIVLLCFLTVQSQLQPWRVAGANVLDSACSNALIVILVCGAASTDIDMNSSSLTILASGCVIAVVAVGCCALTTVVHKFALQRRPYSKFLCHHKAHAGAQARMLKIMLLGRGFERVFIDSDNLLDLDTLFDVVKFRTRHLVVYLTSHTLTRPWCVGEIFSAFVAGVEVLAVHTTSFLSPSVTSASEAEALLDETNCSLAEYKIGYEDVSWALQRLLSQETKAVHMSGDLLGQDKFEHLVRLILNETSGKLPKSHKSTEGAEQSLVLSVDISDDEAAAACEIMHHYISGPVAREVGCEIVRLNDTTMDAEMQAMFIANSAAVLIFLSIETLQTPSQLLAIAEGMLLKKDMAGEIVPISLPYFHFPQKDTLEAIVKAVGLESMAELPNLLDAFFRQIAVAFNTHAAENTIQVQCAEVLKRALAGQGPNVSMVRSGGPSTMGLRFSTNHVQHATVGPRLSTAAIAMVSNSTKPDHLVEAERSKRITVVAKRKSRLSGNALRSGSRHLVLDQECTVPIHHSISKLGILMGSDSKTSLGHALSSSSRREPEGVRNNISKSNSNRSRTSERSASSGRALDEPSGIDVVYKARLTALSL